MEVSRPLNPRPPTPPPPLPRPSELIPKRVLPHLAPKSAGKEFEGELAAIVDSLVAEWQALFPDVTPDAEASAEAREARRRELLCDHSTAQHSTA